MLSIRLGSEWVHTSAISAPVPLRILVLGPDSASIRSEVVEGREGLLNVDPAFASLVDYSPSQGAILYPNGSLVRLHSVAMGLDSLRGARYNLVWLAGMGSWSNSEVEGAMMLLPAIYDPSYARTTEGILATY